MSADLLSSLRAEREKHKPHLEPDPGEVAWCTARKCDSDWPCPSARALDVAIVLVDLATTWGFEAALKRALAAWEGKP